jgi:hypothetical protein
MSDDNSDALAWQNHFGSDLRQDAEDWKDKLNSNYSLMKVDNVGFMIDRIGQECGPLQYIRELTQNSIQAIKRTPGGKGEIVWDYHRPTYEWSDHGIKKLCLIDTGIGMTGEEMVEYINSAFCSSYEQGHDKNFGIGAKVAAATRNPHGLTYFSWKDGDGAMVQLAKDPLTGQYGLVRHEVSSGRYSDWAEIYDDIKPEQIKDHGTVVVLEGESDEDDTFTQPKEKISAEVTWVSHYLNTRYFEVPEGITIRARDHRAYQSSEDTLPHYSMRTVTGQKYILDRISEANGSVELEGATAHWWITRELDGGYYKGLTRGHVAALYQNELYELLPMNRGGVNRLQMFGVVLGYSRVVLYLEPHCGPGRKLVPNTARTRLLLNGEDLPWSAWAAQFRHKMPQEINDLMDAYATRGVKKADREEIKRRIEELQELYNPSRYIPLRGGTQKVSETNLIWEATAPPGHKQPPDHPPGVLNNRTPGHRIYSAFIKDKEGGEEGRQIKGQSCPRIKWVTVKDGSRDPSFIEDRAAHYAKEADFLSINADFRIFDDLITLIELRNPEVPGGRSIIEERVRHHVEMSLTETVITFQSISGSKEWPEDAMDKGLSEEALTAAVLPRQHIVHAVETELKLKGISRTVTAA